MVIKLVEKTSTSTLRAVLEELRLLRQEVSLLFPRERLRGYAHPDRIKRSYERALKQYPRHGNN